ncbi:MAG: hypothetical protein MJ071_07935 [Oscillospiraceae bacterium]|nr:hypothetical protein [Oscillospiraceae bacterium]
MNKKHKESGAIAIETIISLTFFMVAIIGLMMVSMVIRAQAAMQYALNQTAKEISGYYYLLDKIGLAEFTSGGSTSVQQAKVKELNKNIGQIIQFSSNGKATVDQISSNFKDGDFTIPDLSQNKAELEKTVNGLKDLWKSDDKVEMFKTVLQVFGRSMINKAISKYMGGFICQAMIPKYLTSGDVDDYFENVGIDPDSLDFSATNLLQDGRSIQLAVYYEIDLSKLTLGMVQTKIGCKQVASTAAWIRSEGKQTIKSLTELSADVENKKENTQPAAGGEQPAAAEQTEGT